MTKFILSIVFILSSFLLTAQDNFNHSYGGSGRDIAYSMCETSDQGILVLGLTTSFGSGKDMYLLKIDKNGNTVWSRTYGGKKVDSGIKIKKTSDGNYIIIGNTTSFGAKRRDLYLIKINEDGEEIWSHAYGGDLNEFGLDVSETKDGGYILVGETNSFDVLDHDIYMVKVDSKGTLEWSKTMGADSIEFASSVLPVEDGYIIGGETNSIGAGGWDVMMVKTDLEGEVVWTKVYGGQKDEHLNEIIQDDFGHFVFIGSTLSFGDGGRDIFYGLTDPEGNVVRLKTLGEKGDEEPQSVRKVGDDGYVIVGFSNSFNDGLTGQDAYVIRMNKRFKMRWSKTFGGALNDLGFALSSHSSGNFVIAGESVSFSARDDKDIFTVSIKDKRKIETCELTNVQTIRIPLSTKRDVAVDEMFLEEINAESHQIDAHTENQDVETNVSVICGNDKFLIESKEKEEEE